MFTTKRTNERQVNSHGEATLTVKLNVHVEDECSASTDEATLEAKLNARGEAAYERSATHATELHSSESSCKA